MIADLGARFRTALDPHEAGVQMMRLKLRRSEPDASDAEIARRLGEWLRAPDAIPVDHRVVPWPRS